MLLVEVLVGGLGGVYVVGRLGSMLMGWKKSGLRIFVFCWDYIKFGDGL